MYVYLRLHPPRYWNFGPHVGGFLVSASYITHYIYNDRTSGHHYFWPGTQRQYIEFLIVFIRARLREFSF